MGAKEKTENFSFRVLHTASGCCSAFPRVEFQLLSNFLFAGAGSEKFSRE